MKKILAKDKKLRKKLKKKEKLGFVLQNIKNNSNFFTLIRLKAINKINFLNYKNSETLLTNRCVETINKKRYSKLTMYSRHLFLKLVRNGTIHGFQKSSW